MKKLIKRIKNFLYEQRLLMKHRANVEKNLHNGRVALSPLAKELMQRGYGGAMVEAARRGGGVVDTPEGRYYIFTSSSSKELKREYAKIILSEQATKEALERNNDV